MTPIQPVKLKLRRICKMNLYRKYQLHEQVVLSSDYCESHMKSEHRLECGICKLVFKDNSILITHINSEHEQMKKHFKVRGQQLEQKYIKQITSG